jgi:hypothetical protein
VNADDTLESELTVLAYESARRQTRALRDSGLYAPPTPVRENADLQTKMLAAYGRRGDQTVAPPNGTPA